MNATITTDNRRINYKSDFDFIARLMVVAADGTTTEMGFPDFDWEMRLTTGCNGYTQFVASAIGGKLTNCMNDDGQLRIICNNHGLRAGTLYAEFHAHLPNSIYPDREQLSVTPQPLPIELVLGEGDIATPLEVQMIQPFIRGEKGERGEQGEKGAKGDKGDKGDALTYADLTDAQKQELAKPTLDAVANKADKIIIIEETATSLAITPNVLHRWGEVASLDITLAEPTDTTIVNEYMVEFVSGETATTLTMPATIKWAIEPSIEATKTYQISIVNNIAVIVGV